MSNNFTQEEQDAMKTGCCVGGPSCLYPDASYLSKGTTLGICRQCELPVCNKCSGKRLYPLDDQAFVHKMRRVCNDCYSAAESVSAEKKGHSMNTNEIAPSKPLGGGVEVDMVDMFDDVEAEEAEESTPEIDSGWCNFYDVVEEASTQENTSAAARGFLQALACIRLDVLDEGTDMLKRIDRELDKLASWIDEVKGGIEVSLEESGEFDDVQPLDFTT